MFKHFFDQTPRNTALPALLQTLQPQQTGPGSHGFVAIQKPDGEVETIRYDAFVGLLIKAMGSDVLDRLHAAVGVSGEAGELLDAVKKNWVYNKPIDRENVVEELGDIRFYCQALMNSMKISEQEVLQHNALKLSRRYGELRYSDQAAQIRADKKAGE